MFILFRDKANFDRLNALLTEKTAPREGGAVVILPKFRGAG
jgi:hypothetical protein